MLFGLFMYEKSSLYTIDHVYLRKNGVESLALWNCQFLAHAIIGCMFTIFYYNIEK